MFTTRKLFSVKAFRLQTAEGLNPNLKSRVGGDERSKVTAGGSFFKTGDCTTAEKSASTASQPASHCVLMPVVKCEALGQMCHYLGPLGINFLIAVENKEALLPTDNISFSSLEAGWTPEAGRQPEVLFSCHVRCENPRWTTDHPCVVHMLTSADWSWSLVLIWYLC